MITCPLGDFRRWQHARATRYQSFFGTMTIVEAKAHLRDWPPFTNPRDLDAAIRKARVAGNAKDHMALCALMQSGMWR